MRIHVAEMQEVLDFMLLMTIHLTDFLITNL